MWPLVCIAFRLGLLLADASPREHACVHRNLVSVQLLITSEAGFAYRKPIVGRSDEYKIPIERYRFLENLVYGGPSACSQLPMNLASYTI